jgi:cell division protein FtsQ
LERLKAISRNPSPASEAEPYRPELIADEEPRYLRRQKPVEIRRKKFGARGWPFYRRVLAYGALAAAAVITGVAATRYLLYSPQMLLIKPDQIEVIGNRIVAREAVLQQFVHDRNRSVLLLPLESRRSQIEQLSWVESARVQRILPNRVRVDLTERTPIAFLRTGNELALIDAHGVILDRPEGEDLHFPIVTGLSEDLPRDQREKHMQLYQEFLKDIELVRGGSSSEVSEADLSNIKNVRVVITGLSRANDSQAVAVDFGPGEFTGKYKHLVDNFEKWQRENGCIGSINLQYARQAVVNPTPGSCPVAAKTR